MKRISISHIERFRAHMVEEEKAAATVERYTRDVKRFYAWLERGAVDKATVIAYKEHLLLSHAVTGVNTVLSALNCFFRYWESPELCVKTIRMQRSVFEVDGRELTKEEYLRLLVTAKEKNKRLYLLMQTICSTGIRVSEVRFITVEALHDERAEIYSKGTRRFAFLPTPLCEMLRQYAAQQGIEKGPIFVTRTGTPLDRCNIWASMRRLCQRAGVPKEKVFPHNLRHLFARTHYAMQKDIVRLADLLGHKSINTTRIYTVETGEEHQKQIRQLGLLG